MTRFQRAARGLAGVLVEASWPSLDDLFLRASEALGRRPRWLRPAIRRVVAAFPERRPREHQLAAFLVADVRLRAAWCKKPFPLPPRRRPPPVMAPAPGPPSSWDVPAIVTTVDLAARLGLEPEELDWFVDAWGLERSPGVGPLWHYGYRWKPKRNGSPRLIEAPKGRLKAIQRQVLQEVLEPIPPHEAAHGFRPGRSVRTFIEPHVGRVVVLKMDLQNFFPSIARERVVALFRTVGYPEAVARALAGLCTNRVPLGVWKTADAPPPGPESWRARQLYRAAHLPQGAPTSPALANLCAHRLDTRLAGLATSAGATYTRYADDLAFSGEGPFARSVTRFPVHVAAIVLEEGFLINHRKTRVLRQGVRQKLAGVVVNVRPNVPRDDFDQLKAILHNCQKLGPAAQNRSAQPDFRAHLLGRIAHVATLNPDRAAKLRGIFDRVVW